MKPLTQPLRDEHKELWPHVEALRTVADSLDDAPYNTVCQGVDDIYSFLTGHLIPHAEAEEASLYPMVAEIMGAPQATATMSRDHVEVGRLIQELALLRSGIAGGTMNPAQARALRRILYGLYMLLKVHFAKEEEIYLPLLDAKLTPETARQLFDAMEASARAHAAH